MKPLLSYLGCRSSTRLKRSSTSATGRRLCSGRRHHHATSGRVLGTVVIALMLFAFCDSGYGQISPEEHAKHHPGQAGGANAGQPGAQKSGATNGTGGMAAMMEGMMGGAPARRPLYPSLIAVSELTSEQRQLIEQQANERMREGLAALSQGVERLAEAAQAENPSAMQTATRQMHAALGRLESGERIQRALADGRVPADIALDWFKREMRLSPAPAVDRNAATFGASWFHFFLMAFLLIFAAVMIGMYFYKMRRAAQLLQALTGSTAGGSLSSTPSSGAQTALHSHAVSIPDEALETRNASLPVVPSSSDKWSGNLRVAEIFVETPNVKTFRLVNPLGGFLPFNYLPGQFLTLTVSTDGKRTKRGYTIASSPTQRDYAEITVKHEESGIVSGYLHEQVKQGDLVDISGPLGAFIFTGRECKCILLIGGGVGVTPLMSVLRYLTGRSWLGDIYLIYSCRSPQDIIFREELDYLQRRHPNVHVVITVSRPEGTEWRGTTGRITKELIAQTVPELPSRYVHVCGPAPFTEAVKATLAELGVPSERIKTEAFGPAVGKPMPLATGPSRRDEESHNGTLTLPTVSFARSDRTAPLPPDKTVLDIADEVGVDIDNYCRVGTCGSCKVRLLSGEVTMEVQDSLDANDKAGGVILACQAKSKGNVVVDA